MLVKKRKAMALRRDGVLRCKVCGMTLTEVYGEIGEGFIECHHTRPIEKMLPGEETKINDLELVCPNCHRMLHRGRSTMTIERLRETMESRRRQSTPPA